MFNAILRKTGNRITVYAILNDKYGSDLRAIVFCEGEWFNIPLDEVIPI